MAFAVLQHVINEQKQNKNGNKNELRQKFIHSLAELIMQCVAITAEHTLRYIVLVIYLNELFPLAEVEKYVTVA